MAIQGIEIDEIDEGESACGELARRFDRLVEECLVACSLDDGAGATAGEYIGDLADGNDFASRRGQSVQ